MAEGTIRGMDTPQRLRRFFEAKGHRNLVISTAVVMDLPLPHRAALLDLLHAADLRTAPSGPAPDDGYRRQLQQMGVGGYLTVPIDTLCERLSIEQLERLQEWVCVYRDLRQARGEPVKMEVCECTQQNGQQRPPKANCPKCAGSGQIQVVVEMSAEEIALAQGAGPGAATI